MIHYFLKPFKLLYTRSEASMAKLCCTGLQKGRTNIIFSAAITQRINECILIFILPTPAISLFYSAPRTYSLRQYANHIQRISHQHHLHKMQHTLNKICIKSGSYGSKESNQLERTWSIPSMIHPWMWSRDCARYTTVLSLSLAEKEN